MTTPNPACTVNTLNPPQSVAGGSTVNVALANTTGAAFWGLSVVGTDELNTVAAVEATLTVSSGPKTATFTAPSGLGSAVILQSTVGAAGSMQGHGVDVNGNYQPSYTTTFKVNVPCTSGLCVMGENESFEQDSNYGWISEVNKAIRAANGGGSNEVWAAVTANPAWPGGAAANLVATVTITPSATGKIVAEAFSGLVGLGGSTTEVDFLIYYNTHGSGLGGAIPMGEFGDIIAGSASNYASGVGLASGLTAGVAYDVLLVMVAQGASNISTGNAPVGSLHVREMGSNGSGGGGGGGFQWTEQNVKHGDASLQIVNYGVVFSDPGYGGGGGTSSATPVSPTGAATFIVIDTTKSASTTNKIGVTPTAGCSIQDPATGNFVTTTVYITQAGATVQWFWDAVNSHWALLT